VLLQRLKQTILEGLNGRIIPTSLEQREKMQCLFPLKAPHRKVSEATVLRRLGKRHCILAAEVQSASFLFDSFSFARPKEKRMSNLKKRIKEKA
jgi:hypothetical protein